MTADEPLLPLSARTLPEIFRHAASLHGGRPALDFFGAVTRYGELEREAERLAAGLAAMGIAKGSHVGLLMPNSPQYVMAYFATLMLGAVVVNLNPLYAAEELEGQARDARVDVLITFDLADMHGKAASLLRSGAVPRLVVAGFAKALPRVKSLAFRALHPRALARPLKDPRVAAWEELAARARPLRAAVAVSPDDLAVLQFTGGTTGSPKAAMLTHGNLAANVRQIRMWFADVAEGGERMLAILPFFHVFGMTTLMNFGISIGAEITLLPRFEGKSALAAFRRRKPTIFAAVPTLLSALLDHPSRRAGDMSSLRHCISGGAALPPPLAERFEAETGCPVLEGYGLSETAPVLTINPVKGPRRAGSAGLPVPGTRIVIRDEEGQALAAGRQGEITVAGPQVMPGYWQRPAETEAAFVQGYFRTGDVGWRDSEGFVYVADRLKDMINSSGFKVWPRRIEEVLLQHPDVAEACVIGVKDKRRGEAPEAYVRLRAGAGASPAALIAFLKPHLAPFELPARVKVLEELPKTFLGKPSRKALRELG